MAIPMGTATLFKVKIGAGVHGEKVYVCSLSRGDLNDERIQASQNVSDNIEQE